MSKVKITNTWKIGINPVNKELVIYPKGERPLYPERNECPKCWENNGAFVPGKLERHEFSRSIYRSTNVSSVTIGGKDKELGRKSEWE